jgi:hypothetical protein
MIPFKKFFVGLALLPLASPAPAQKPTITQIPFTGSVLAVTKAICGFDTIDSPQPGKPNGEKLILFGNAGLITGPLFVQLKNLNTGQIVNVNSSGPVSSITFSGSTTTLIVEGPGLWNVPPPPLEVTQAAGLPPAPYIRGSVKVMIDQDGNIVSMTKFHGTAQSVCDLFK